MQKGGSAQNSDPREYGVPMVQLYRTAAQHRMLLRVESTETRWFDMMALVTIPGNAEERRYGRNGGQRPVETASTS